jgi:hypothetical protein
VSAVGSATTQTAVGAPIATTADDGADEHYVNDAAPDQVDPYASQFVSYA